MVVDESDVKQLKSLKPGICGGLVFISWANIGLVPDLLSHLPDLPKPGFLIS